MAKTTDHWQWFLAVYEHLLQLASCGILLVRSNAIVCYRLVETARCLRLIVTALRTLAGVARSQIRLVRLFQRGDDMRSSCIDAVRDP